MKLLNTKTRIYKILQWDCFHTAEDIENRRKNEGNLTAPEMLGSMEFADYLPPEQWNTKLFCHGQSNGKYSVFREIYYDAEILDVYEYAAMTNAVHHTRNKE